MLREKAVHTVYGYLPLGDRYGISRRPDLNCVGVETLPENIPQVATSPQELADIFQTSTYLWNLAFRKQAAIDLLQGSEKNVIQESCSFGYLKDIRIRGMLLRTGYKAATADNSCPLVHSELVKRLGNLADSRDMQDTQLAVSGLLRTLEKYPDDLSHHICEPGDMYSFGRYFEDTATRMETMLSRNQMSHNEFHDFKKVTRHMLHLYHLAFLTKTTEDHYSTYIVFKKVNSSLGSVIEHNRNQNSLEIPSGVSGILNTFLERRPKYT